MTPAQFIDKYALRIDAEYQGEEPTDYGHRMMYEVTVARPSVRNGRWPEFKTSYFHGSGIPGFEEESLILCVALDLQASLDCDSYEEFARDFGYDEDSLSGYRTWEACNKQARELQEWATLAMIRDLREVREDDD